MVKVNSTMDDYLPTRSFLMAAIVFKSLFAVLGVAGNLTVIVRNLVMKSSKTPTDYLITNLAIADLITCATYYPAYAIEFAHIVRDVSINQQLFCRTVVSINSTTVVLSITTLLAITADRYYFITTPLKYPLVMTVRKALCVIAAIWLIALFFAGLLVIFTTNGEKRLSCPTDYTVTILGVVIFVHIPTIFVLYFNYKMFKVARSHRRRIAQQCGIAQQSSFSQSATENTGHNRPNPRSSLARAFKAIKTFAIVTGVFVLCYMPYSVTLIVGTFLCHNLMCIPLELFIIFGDLVSLSSVLNPFIYNMPQNRVLGH